MQLAPIPVNEAQRLESVCKSNILDSEPEVRFDRLTRMIHQILDVPSVFITLVDKERVWFKSSYGAEMKEEPRDISFCGHTICKTVTSDATSRIFEVTDAYSDPRFNDNKFITETCGVRYYMGFVLQSDDGQNIGTLCVVDNQPRSFSHEQKKIFTDFGFMAEAELNRKDLLPENRETNIFSSITKEEDPQIYVNRFLEFYDKLSFTISGLNEFLKKDGLSYKEWRVLNEIAQEDLVTPLVIREKLGMSGPLVSKYLDSLESQGLIERITPMRGDKRYVHIVCSEHGKNIWLKGTKSTRFFGNMFLDGAFSESKKSEKIN